MVIVQSKPAFWKSTLYISFLLHRLPTQLFCLPHLPKLMHQISKRNSWKKPLLHSQSKWRPFRWQRSSTYGSCAKSLFSLPTCILVENDMTFMWLLKHDLQLCKGGAQYKSNSHAFSRKGGWKPHLYIKIMHITIFIELETQRDQCYQQAEYIT